MAKTKTVVTVISKISERPVNRDAALVVIHGIDLGRKYDLMKEATVVGRSSKADIQIDQEAISRNHARFSIAAGRVSLKDLGSTNGTYVNDEMITTDMQLRNGDLVKIGRTIFKFIAGGNIESAYHDEIYRLTTVDGLTQVFNRRYFEETVEREISRCHRYGRALSLVMVDIDHFKTINDTYGHLAGDHVLKPWRRRFARAFAAKTFCRATAAKSSRCCCPRSSSRAPCRSPRRCASSSRSSCSSSTSRRFP